VISSVSEPIPVSQTDDFSGSWESLPTPIPPMAQTSTPVPGPTPNHLQELPTWNNTVQSNESKNPLGESFNRLTAYLWQNTLVAFAVILSLLLLFLGLAGFVMKSCGA
jgi:hypothetical protein